MENVRDVTTAERCVSRREMLSAAGGAVLAAAAPNGTGLARAGTAVNPAPAAAPAPAFPQRGYYLTLMRMPTYGLPAWRRAVDCFASDGANRLILWMAGGFRSRKFPITWKYNEGHENVRADFVPDLIRYAHGKGIRVLLGFTPFGYDGVNQYPLAHPELKALKEDGRPTDEFGIHCWGWNLCPSKPQSQRFMLEYAREMYLDFYPDADGLLIESSDYAICHCPDCLGTFYDREFDFVSALSQDVWKAKPDATVVVYPHYFSGSKVPGLGADAARKPFDARWTLFFTPHSAHVDHGLVARARSSIWSDDAPALHDPPAIQARARTAREAGVTGYIPSLEGFSYVATRVEEGRADLVGKRQVPFGFGWLRSNEMPFDELPVRVNRVAFREFSRDPGLPFDEFKARLGRDVFGPEGDPVWTEDLLLLNRVFFEGRTWRQPAPLASPARVRFDAAAGRVTPEALGVHRATLRRVGEMAVRHADAPHPARRDLHRIGVWLVDQWSGANAKILNPGT
jgi:hypothetical protein